MKSIVSVVVLCSLAGLGETFLSSGFGGGVIGNGVYPSGTTCCCCCCNMNAYGGQVVVTTTPRPTMFLPIPIPVPCCPCPPQQQMQQQQCCSIVSPYQIQPALTATAAPVGVPDIVTGPCGEIIVPLFNPPVSTNQVIG